MTLRRKTPMKPGKPLERKTRLRAKKRINARNRKRAAEAYERDFGRYADLIRDLPCCVCGMPGPSDPHHVRSRGAGGDRRDLVPLDWLCHGEIHQTGRKTFESRHGVDLGAIAAKLWERYGGEE